MSRRINSFGEGSFVGQVCIDPSFSEQSMQDQARYLGWAAGCPVVEGLIDPSNTAPGRGPEAMRDRYGEVSFWFGQICREVEDTNIELALKLRANVPRLDDEPPIKLETESIPIHYYGQMSPMNTLAGYALPRVFIEQLGSKDVPQDRKAQRMSAGLNIVRKAADETVDPTVFLAIIAEEVARAEADPLKVLKHIVGQGWMDEHNSPTTLAEAKAALEVYAPALWEQYSGFTADQKTQLRFA